MQAPAPNATPAPAKPPKTIGELAARLMYLQNTEKQIEKEIKEIMEECELRYSSSEFATKTDINMKFSDESTKKVRLSRQGTGTYFKPNEEHKEEFNNLRRQIEGLFLDAGKAEMAEKACTWKAQVVKS